MSHDWQSNGWCTTHCPSNYAYAVILWKECWCTNYIPQEQEDTSQCSTDCPGFPSEKCGNRDKNLYVYLKLDGSPSGTKGTARPTSADVSSAPSVTSSPSSTKATTVSAIRFFVFAFDCAAFQSSFPDLVSIVKSFIALFLPILV